MHVNFGLAGAHFRQRIHRIRQGRRDRFSCLLLGIELLRFDLPLVQLFIHVGPRLIKSQKCILAEDLIIIEVKWISGLGGRTRILRVLESIIFDAEDVLNQRKVRP